MHVCICICMCVYVYACVCMYMRVCVCICVCVYVYVCVCTYMHAHAHTHALTLTHAYCCIHTHVYSIIMHILTQTGIYIRIYIVTWSLSCLLAIFLLCFPTNTLLHLEHFADFTSGDANLLSILIKMIIILLEMWFLSWKLAS